MRVLLEKLADTLQAPHQRGLGPRKDPRNPGAGGAATIDTQGLKFAKIRPHVAPRALRIVGGDMGEGEPQEVSGSSHGGDNGLARYVFPSGGRSKECQHIDVLGAMG